LFAKIKSRIRIPEDYRKSALPKKDILE